MEQSSHSNHGLEASPSPIPPGAIRPIIDHYIEFWFGRGVEEFSDDNRTPLMEAAEQGDEASVFMLLMHWAMNNSDAEQQKNRSMYVNKQARGIGHGHTALHMAAAQPNQHVLGLLLAENGIDIEILDTNGLTPLHWAATYGQQASVEMLIDKGADINSTSSDTNSIFNRCTPLHAALRSQYESVAHYLIQKGADVHQVNGHGRDARFEAASYGCVSIMQLLLDRGADPNAYADGDTLVNHAAAHGYESMVELLINEGADVQARNEGEKSPLHFAASTGSDGLVKFLMEKGADIFAVEHQEGADAILSAASGACQVSTLQLLLDSGANIQAREVGGGTPLHLAVSKARPQTVRYLLDRCADINAKDGIGRTPLHWACELDIDASAAMVGILLESEADFSVKDCNDRTPLHDAATKGLNASVLKLLSKGAEINVNDCNGRNPIQAAAQGVNPGTFQIILQFLLGAH